MQLFFFPRELRRFDTAVSPRVNEYALYSSDSHLCSKNFPLDPFVDKAVRIKDYGEGIYLHCILQGKGLLKVLDYRF